MDEKNYSELEDNIGYCFTDKSLLATALLHRSYRFENVGTELDNERLEFLGDAILGFLCAVHLFDVPGEHNEGILTTLRSRASSGRTLAHCAREIRLGDWLYMGLGEEQSGGRKRRSNLANALEAILGAAYLDGGIEAAQRIFDKIFVAMIDSYEHDIWAENPKGKLQEYSQSKWKTAPIYKVTSQEGPPHNTTFTVTAQLHDGSRSQGVGASKRVAEERAASNLLDQLLE